MHSEYVCLSVKIAHGTGPAVHKNRAPSAVCLDAH